MEWFFKFYNKNKKIIISISLVLFVILFLLPLITKRNMNISASYTRKEEVALYIMQYHELPPNYITKAGLSYLKEKGLKYDNYIVGGDTHINSTKLTDKGISDTATLKECDIKGDIYDLTDNKRGSYRLIYTCNVKNVRVFYTDNHYDSFVELTNFELQLTRNIFWIIFGVYAVIFTGFYITIYILKRKQLTGLVPKTI